MKNWLWNQFSTTYYWLYDKKKKKGLLPNKKSPLHSFTRKGSFDQSMYSIQVHAVSFSSASGQSGDLRLSIVSSSSEDIFTGLC